MSYPNLRATDLVPFQRIKAALSVDPGYLDRADCPYDAGTKAFLRDISPMAAVGAADSVFLGGDGDNYEVITGQIDQIYRDLMELRVTDAGEKIQIAKAKASLVEKLVTMKERVQGLKEVSDFKKAVIAGVDSLPVVERDAFLKRLEAL